MFDVIVVGTDGSDSASIAVQRAATLATLTGATLHVVSAYRHVSLGSVAMAASAGRDNGRPRAGEPGRDCAGGGGV